MAGMDSEVNSLTMAALWQDLVGTRTGWRAAGLVLRLPRHDSVDAVQVVAFRGLGHAGVCIPCQFEAVNRGWGGCRCRSLDRGLL
jgi:hypothetical protein